MTESLLIVRLKLKSLLEDEEWEEAAAVGMSGLRAAAAAPPSESNNEETTKIATALADLGLLVDADVVSRFLCGAHSCGHLAQPLLREATVALKRLKGHDVEAWSRGILSGGAAKLETMDAALQLLDTATSHVVVSHPAFQSTIQRELCSPDEARRAGALQVIGTAVLTTPALAVPLLPVLERAVFVETAALKQAALANVLDAAFALARLPPPTAEGSDEQQLFGSLMQWLPQMLSAPLKGLQTLAALGLAKLVLHRKEASLLCACTDPEHLIAQLGRRYTACDQLGTDLAAGTHVPDPMPILLAFFEELKARRQDDLGNTVASALRSRPDTRGRCAKRPQLAATGCSPPRAARVLSSSRRSEEGLQKGPPTHRRQPHQVRFLVVTLSPCEPQVSWMVLDALEGKRRLHEIDAETHRCAKFLFASVDSDNSDVVTAAICMNVENELSLTLSPAEVVAWLGKTAEARA